MANMCSNCMAVYGDREQLERLLAIIFEARAEAESEDMNEVDLTFKKAGYTDRELDFLWYPFSYYMGVDKEISTNANGQHYFNVTYESCWSPNYEAWDAMLARFFPGLKQVTLAEEEGNEVYVNTDTEGRFFTERYYVQGAVGDCYASDLRWPYVKTGEQALELVNAMCEKAGVKAFADIKEALDFFEEEGNNPFPGEDFYLRVYPYARG